MDDKDNQRDNGIAATETAENDGKMELEEATSDLTLSSATRCTPSPPNTLSNHSSSVYSNSHHTQVRRSTDDREEDLIFESEENRRCRQYGSSESSDSPMCFGRFQNSDEFSNGTSVNAQLDREQMRAVAQPHKNVSLQSTTTPQQESCGLNDEQVRAIAQPLGNISLQSTTTPQQESCCLHGEDSKHSKRSENAHGSMDVERFHRNPESSHVHLQKLCTLVLFKRGIIARDELIHALYLIPYEDFQKKFPKIKQYEAVVCHGTEFPVGEENEPMFKCSLYRPILITDLFSVRFEMVHGENFSIVCPSVMTAHVSQIFSRSEDRIGGGFSITVPTRCTGGKDKLFQDSVRMIFQSGNTTLNLIFPIAYYEANVSPWLYDSQAVTAMPDEDREVLRCCHMKLIENIGDVISVCEHLYQHKILDCDDLQEIRSITRKTDCNAHVLRTIQTRGNILDLVIEIMRGKRENQEAAAILQRERFQRTDRK